MMVNSAISDFALTLAYIGSGLWWVFFRMDKRPVPLDPEIARSRNT